MLSSKKKLTYNEFLGFDNNEELVEFIDGYVYSQASPSISHQDIVGNLFIELKSFFNGKPCKPMISPVDVILKSDTETSRVIPDLFVICDKKGLNDKNYEGVPTMVIEVVSPSSASRDFVTKLNLYMRFGVKEYWIVSPQKRNVQMFNMQENGEYGEPMVFNETNILNSLVFSDFQLDLKSVFE